MKNKHFLLWVALLSIEILRLYSIINNPYVAVDVFFYVILIVVTLIVGITGLFYFRKNN